MTKEEAIKIEKLEEQLNCISSENRKIVRKLDQLKMDVGSVLWQMDNLNKNSNDCEEKSEEEEKPKEEIGFKDDPIFLLSCEEYERYEDVIPKINTWWWLRSPGEDSDNATLVDNDGNIYYDGYYFYLDNYGVRPGIKLSYLPVDKNKRAVGRRYIYNNFPFIIIDEEKGLAIAEVPITFDKFNDKSNDYENSYIRKFLLDWYS